jgi:hypothetical protein
MAQISWVITFVLSLAASVATMGIGAFLLRNAARDSLDIAATLPTRSLKEDTNETRESNRRKAFCEMLLLIAVRSVLGAAVVIFGAIFLIWICSKFLALFHV